MRYRSALLALVLTFEGSAAGASGATGVEEARARARTVRLRIEPRRAADAGLCGTLGPNDLTIRLRGEVLSDPGLLLLARETEPAVHALVIDTSGSMLGQLEHVRRAAAEYVEQLRPDEAAMVMSFDETAVLWQGVTDDRQRLKAAIQSVRMGGLTSLLDALHDTLREIGARRERPVVVLLTDGVDSTSLHDRDDVRALTEGRPDLTIFVIGLAVPEISTSSPKPFLWRLAERTNGEYFETPTPARLPAAYRRIRAMLDSEAILTVSDPDPDVEQAGELTVRSARPECKVNVLHQRSEGAGDPLREPIPRPYPQLPQRIPLPPGDLWNVHLNSAHHSIDPACGPPSPGIRKDAVRLLDAYWRAEVEPGVTHGCALDVVMETGMLYDPMKVTRWSANDWIKLRTRPFEMRVPALGQLPHRPEEVLDTLAAFAQSVAEAHVRTDPRKRPAALHGRPFEDYPGLLHGRMFSELRPQLAHALFLYPDYQAWALRRLGDEAAAEMGRLERAFRRRLPDIAPDLLQAAVRESEAGRRLMAQAAAPSANDLQRYLGAWLGDVPAHDLLVRWESLWIDRLIDSAGRDPGVARFPEAWRELRRVFFAPSYARMLTLLFPIHDADRDAIGFYRILLPRVSWLLPRVKGYKRHPDWTDLPLDLVPDAPLALAATEHVLERTPGLAEQLTGAGYRTASVVYRLLDPPRLQDPRTAFRRTRIEVRFAVPGSGGAPADVHLEADLSFDGGIPEVTGYRLSNEGHVSYPLDQKWTPRPTRNPVDSALPSTPVDSKSRSVAR